MTMPSDPLFGVTLKIDRAKKHLRDLESAIGAFLARGPFKLTSEDEQGTGDLVYRIRILEEVPTEWSPLIGDVIHNLRSALDHLACQLVIHGGGTVKRTTTFPIADDEPTFKKTCQRHYWVQVVQQ